MPLSLRFLLVFLLFSCSKPYDTTEQDEAILSKEAELVSFTQASDRKDYKEAYRLAQLLAARFPKNASAWCKVGYAATLLGNQAEAILAYERALKENPNHAKAWYNLGVVRGDQDRVKDEISCYQHAVALRPSYSKALNNLALAYHKIGKDKAALKAYQRALEYMPDLPEETVKNTNISDEISLEAIPWPRALTFSKPSLLKSQDRSTNESLYYYRWNDQSVFLNRLVEVSKLPVDQLKLECFWLKRDVPVFKDLFKEQALAIKYYAQGKEEEQRQEWDRAMKSYRQALQLLWDQPIVWNDLGIIQAQLERWEESISSFKKAKSLSPAQNAIRHNLAIAYFRQARQLTQNHQETQAIACFKKSLELNPADQEVRWSLISVLQQNSQWGQAQIQYEDLVQRVPASGESWFGLAVSSALANHRQRAMEALSKAKSFKQDSPQLWHWDGVEQARRGEYREAAISLQNCLSLQPQNADAWYHQGLVASHLHQSEKMIVSLKKAIDLDPQALYREALAVAYQMTDQVPLAIAEYKRLLENDENQSSLWKKIAQCYELNQNWEAAIRAYQKAVDFKPDDGEAWSAMAYAFGEEGKLKDSKITYQKAVSLGVNSADIFNNLGVMHARLREYKEAFNVLKKADNLLKNDAQILTNTAAVLYHLGQEEEFERTMKLIQKLNPDQAKELLRYYPKFRN